MSRYIATRAIRGANNIVHEFETMLSQALAEKGPETPVEFPNTAYHLPLVLGMTGREVEKLGDLQPVLDTARGLLHPVPPDRRWTPYLGETLDAGMATLLAEEGIEAVRFVYDQQPERLPGFRLAGGTSFTSPEFQASGDGHLNGPIDDIQLRSWGIQLVDGRMPGFAAIVGCAKSNEVAVQIVRELQRRNILCFLSGNVNGRSIIHQLMEEGVELGYDTYTVPFGTDTISAIYALGFATRSALTFGGLKSGQARDILLYNKNRVFAFVLALGEVDDLKYATAAGAINFGFPVIADTVIPEILPTGVTTYEHVVSMPFDEIEGADDLERAERLVQKCIEVRGVKVKVSEVPVPVPYGSAFEGEVVRKTDMRVEFGGKYAKCFEYLRMTDFDAVQDGKIEVIGPGFSDVPVKGATNMGIVVEVAGRQMQADFEPVLERQVHHFINGASGIQHIGQRDITWIRISKTAAEKGFDLRHFGDILHARFHEDFGAIVDKVQVTIITEPAAFDRWLGHARAAYGERNVRLADMIDESVEEFYSCTLCLPEGEEIVLGDGSFMPVEQLVETVVEERDLTVTTFAQHGLTVRPVGELFINPSPERLVKITLSNGNTLTLTANHKVLVDTAAGLEWLPAGKLQSGAMLLDGWQTEPSPSTGEPCFIIDYLPDDYRVSDDAFMLDVLRPAILVQYGSFDRASKVLGIPYQRLYSALYEREGFSRQRFTLGEVKHIVTGLGLNWEEIKQQIRVFQFGCELKTIRLDEEVMYAAGLVAADGSVRWRGEEGRSGVWVQFTNTEAALIDRFSEIHQYLFGAPPEVYTTDPTTSTSGDLTIVSRRPVSVCYAYNTLLGRLMAGLGIGQMGVQGKWSGEVISTLSVKLIAAFMRGLFDGDGHISGKRAFISTRRYREAQHIHLLLKKLGIASYISETTRGYQVGTRANDDFARFRDLVFSEHPQKRQKMEQVVLKYDSRHVVRTDAVPLACGQQLKALLEEHRDRLHLTKLPVDYKTITAWTGGRRRASKAKLAALLDGLRGVVAADHPLYQELVHWTRSELRFERVKKIERVNSPNGRVYNFSVEETHNYLVNGVVVKNCQSFAPNHVCVVSPERLGLCGAYNWLDCKASFRINPTGPNQPIRKGMTLDPTKGYWQGSNEFVESASHQHVQEVAMYSIMENPMTACGCFECIAMVIPEANGIMIVSREDTSMTPAGMTFSTLAGMAGGGLQTPGIMGHGKFYIISPKFISADGGFKRVVWMSSILKQQMAEQLKLVAEREGDLDLIEKIADETICTDVEGLLPFLEEKGHPALEMPSIF